mmetsp:Transcript_19999/g.28731  ORF Transcript_19999/g.28731 Transcript_19999/m.28731 type:complete len:375 (+) Transcript_19999:56-1180(+)|eukprot:CAMPEP_0185033128 /NCGR_PEP_ID=MMETSP1103-20130426/21819_1 /TAXON_ID=36769 /ORGANISM="Paraphysomonas bandaiensis, Strain Caron Lab Isolate" /LENGTH=374 /DNA_ID=CAMNT_0027569291 /DNA_START=11 /DNA_END=1135 /DNA_ORIENTATION=-
MSSTDMIESCTIHSFQDLGDVLHSYDNASNKYLSMHTAGSVIDSLINQPNNTNFDNEELKSNKELDEQFEDAARVLLNEIFEYRTELEKRDAIEFEKPSPQPLLSDQDKSTKLTEMQAELAELENMVSHYDQEQSNLENEMADLISLKEKTTQELNSMPSVATVSNNASSDKSKEVLVSLQERSANLTEVLSGLESMFGLQLESTNWTDSGDGVVVGLVVGKERHTLELDSCNKLISIQSSNPPEGLDTARLLCDCAQLDPPQDVRHAAFVLCAHSASLETLKEHVKALRRSCLVRVDNQDCRKMELTFRNGVTAKLRIHECYSHVPNGVHIEGMTGVGGWCENELEEARLSINSMCLKTIPAVVEKLQLALND